MCFQKIFGFFFQSASMLQKLFQKFHFSFERNFNCRKQIRTEINMKRRSFLYFSRFLLLRCILGIINFFFLKMNLIVLSILMFLICIIVRFLFPEFMQSYLVLRQELSTLFAADGCDTLRVLPVIVSYKFIIIFDQFRFCFCKTALVFKGVFFWTLSST